MKRPCQDNSTSSKMRKLHQPLLDKVKNFPSNPKYIFIDTETTGKPPFDEKIAEPIQLGLLFCDGHFHEIGEFSMYILSKEESSDKALYIHGIKRSELKKRLYEQYNGKCEDDELFRIQIIIMKEIVEYLLSSDAYICSHNLDFDWFMLTHGCQRQSMQTQGVTHGHRKWSMQRK